MISYLLDTNILSHLIKHPHGVVRAKINQIGLGNIATSIIVAAELRYGIQKRGSSRLTIQVEAVLDAIEVVSWDTPADIHYGAIRAALAKKGTPISANDLLIAAHALALSFVLVTDNVSEFARVPGLKLENWLAD